MLRAIFRRRFKDNTSGIVIENQIYSIAFENHDIENELRAGGFGETGFEVRELIGVEVAESPSAEPKKDAGEKRKILQPTSTRAEELLRHIAVIVHYGGVDCWSLERVAAAIRRLTIRHMDRSLSIGDAKKALKKAEQYGVKEWNELCRNDPTMKIDDKERVPRYEEDYDDDSDSQAPSSRVETEKAPAGGTAPKPKDPQPESVQTGLLDAITLIAFESGYRMSDEERVIAIQRLTMRWREKFENMPPLTIEHFLQGVMLVLEQLRREQESAVHAVVDENDA